jgi:chromosome partitioning protein
MQIVAVCNTKGGVGKSTLAAALAVRAAQDGDRRVAIVDLDAQQTLAAWFKDRSIKDRPEVFGGELSPASAVEKLSLAGWDLVFLDGPPSFLELVKEAIEVADLVLIPVKPSVPDLRSTQDAVVLARQARKPILVVINDATARDNTVDTTRAVLDGAKVPVAKQVMHHRVSHMHGFAAGKTAAEVNGGRDREAAKEIDALWVEVMATLKNGVRK